MIGKGKLFSWREDSLIQSRVLLKRSRKIRTASLTGKVLAIGCSAELVVATLTAFGLLASPIAQAATTCPTTQVGSFTAGPSTAPLASCLLSIGNDTTNGLNPPQAGVAVTVSNLSSLGGLATDGTTVYLLNADSGNVVTTPLSALPTPSMTSGTDFSATGTINTGTGAASAGSSPPWGKG